MKNRQLLCAALLTTMGLLMSLWLSHATAQEATVAIAGNHSSVALAGWSHAAGSRELHMVAVLALRNRPEMDELKAQLQQPGSANYHRWLSAAEFMRRFGPTQRQMKKVISWLRDNHLTIVDANLVTRTVRFSGTVSQAERAFSAEIVSRSGDYANVSDPRVPKRLDGTVAAIFGLSGKPGAGRPLSLAGLESADVPSATNAAHLTPQDFWTYYDQSSPMAPGGNGGTRSPDCIALLEGDSIQPAEFESFDTQFDLPPTNLAVVLTPSSKISFGTKHHEVELDVEWAHAVAPNTPIRLYVSNDPASLQHQFDALNLAVSENRCGAISSSIHDGGNLCADFAQISAYAALEAQAVIQGQTFFHASGDFGSFFDCGQPASSQGVTGVQPSIDETGASPDVINVGGTQFSPIYVGGVDTSVLKPGFEQVWNTYPTVSATPNPTPTPTKGGSTGGVSVVFGKPAWQESISAYGLKPGEFTMRGVPDVASVANADEPGLWVAACFSKPCPVTPPFPIKISTGCPGTQNLCFFGNGGTSAGSPVWAGISRLLAHNLGTSKLGNINPQLYCLAAAGSPALVDVSQPGQNCPQAGPDCTVFAGYQVGPGYDLGTGLGSADIDKLVGAFPPSVPAASVTASDTRSSGSAGQPVEGGVMTLTNTGSLPETVSTVTLNVSNPALFSFLSLSASVERGPVQAALSAPLSSIVTFTFAPPLVVPVGGKAALTLRAGMNGASQVARRFGSPGSTVSGSGRGAGRLAALLCEVLGLIGFGLVFASSGNRRRIRLFSALFLLIAATPVGCGSDTGVAVIGTSVQSVPPCGIGASRPSVGSATTAVGVTGLPATLDQIRLVK